MSEPGKVTQYLVRLREGDEEALDQVVPLLYDELRQMARWHLQRMEKPTHTFNPTDLVNEVYLKLVHQQELRAGDRNQFFAIASNTMRRILVDYARAKKRIKRGGDAPKVRLDEARHLLTEREADEVLALDEALDRLSALNPRGSQVIQYRFYSGLTLEETAQVMDLSVKTVQRAWVSARAWLRKEVSQELNL